MNINSGKNAALVFSILLSLAVGGAAWIISGGSMEQYEFLAKPPLSPPGYLFPIVWTVLYVLMGISAWLIWKNSDSRRDTALTLYAVQLAVNFFWPIFYFLFGARFLALIWLAFLIILVFLTMKCFSEINSKSAWLLLPYFAWLLFAFYLNLGTFILNI